MDDVLVNESHPGTQAFWGRLRWPVARRKVEDGLRLRVGWGRGIAASQQMGADASPSTASFKVCSSSLSK